jgi:hypothetical protein
VLFADVELRSKDNPQRLASLGLDLRRKGRKLAFAQPCACFDGQWCRIYAQRPVHCRGFECGVLKRVQNGEYTPAQALALIRQVRGRAKKVDALLRALGNHSDQLPLTQRYIDVMGRPFELAGDAAQVRKRGQLLVEIDQLMTCVQKDFLA